MQTKSHNTHLRAIYLVVVAMTWLLSTHPSSAWAQNPAEATWQRFLAHLQSNQPIAGEFRIETDVDNNQVKELTVGKAGSKKDSSPSPKFEPEPTRQILDCRWAWANGREVCEARSTSSNSMYGFLTLPEGNLIGYTDKQYNLFKSNKINRSDINRPALFYFIGGSDHWKNELEQFDFSLHDDKTGATDTLVLEARKGSTTSRLVLERATSRLRRASIHFGERLAWDLNIEGFADNPTDARVFPRKASLAVYLGGDGVPVRKVRLTATKIEFPTAQQVAKQFRLPVPSKALIADRALAGAIVTDKPTDGYDVITTHMPRTPLAERPRFESDASSIPSPGPPPRGNVYWLAALAVVPLILFLIYILIRRKSKRFETD